MPHSSRLFSSPNNIIFKEAENRKETLCFRRRNTRAYVPFTSCSDTFARDQKLPGKMIGDLSLVQQDISLPSDTSCSSAGGYLSPVKVWQHHAGGGSSDYLGYIHGGGYPPETIVGYSTGGYKTEEPVAATEIQEFHMAGYGGTGGHVSHLHDFHSGHHQHNPIYSNGGGSGCYAPAGATHGGHHPSALSFPFVSNFPPTFIMPPTAAVAGGAGGVGQDGGGHVGRNGGKQAGGGGKAAGKTGGGGDRQKPKRKRVATVAQRRAANIRERRRMYSLNESFDNLRKKVPTFAYEKKLSRIETLRLAITYIGFMGDLLQGKSPDNIRLASKKQRLFHQAAQLQQAAAAHHQFAAMMTSSGLVPPTQPPLVTAAGTDVAGGGLVFATSPEHI